MKNRKVYSLLILVAMLGSIAMQASGASSVGSVAVNKYDVSAVGTMSKDVNLAAAAAFAVGFVTGLAVGVIEGFNVGTYLANFLYGGEQLASSLENLDYSKNDLARFDPK
ncbi:MAG: hypothetical protein KF763_14570 [Cyclobacteriaceae bacterium]|nr:hypothetical protein [Cyclobacteriaceae bacterium]